MASHHEKPKSFSLQGTKGPSKYFSIPYPVSIDPVLRKQLFSGTLKQPKTASFRSSVFVLLTCSTPGTGRWNLRKELNSIVTHRPIARQRPQHTPGQQYMSGVFCDPRGYRCYATRDTRVQHCRRGVFHEVRPEAI
jgi:hypothetical protein